LSAQVDLVRRWIEARNARDLACLLELSAPDLEMRLPRGTLVGEPGLRQWIERMSFGVAPHIELDRFYAGSTTVVAGGRNQLRFVDDGVPAGEWTDTAIACRLNGGLVERYESGELGELLAAAGLTDAHVVPAT
jgi:hypothetical protein